jgi:cytochrome c peroxidase
VSFARAFLFAALLFGALLTISPVQAAGEWTESELKTVARLWIGSLPAVPRDPSNKAADDPRAQRMGHRLFFDTRLGAGGWVSCATCHRAELAFTDGKTIAEGVRTATRNTMTLLGAAYSPWFFWDGRKDSLWSQALGPLENPREHAGTRTGFAHVIADDARYRADYEALFGAVPDISDYRRFPPAAAPVDDEISRAAWRDMAPVDRVTIDHVFANLGKAIAAYERLIVPGPSRFDRYAADILAGRESEELSPTEIEGLKLFVGPARCTRCHNGPMFSNFGFHNTGVPAPAGEAPDAARNRAVKQAYNDPFNCAGSYSDAGQDDCKELIFVNIDGPELVGAFKVPTLRSVPLTGPYMHAGQFPTLAAVLDHYNRAPAAAIGTTELGPLYLGAGEIDALEAFLRTLDSPPVTDPVWLAPPR